MRYISTRGQVEPVTFFDAVMMGLATDGGLLLPESIPTVDSDSLSRWAGLRFQDLAVEVMLPFVGGDLSRDELAALVERSYATFDHADVTPVVSVGKNQVLELFHGPTLAFKDVALQFLGNLFEQILKKRGGQLNILGATSGDTGSSAIYGVRGKDGINIFILHPYKRVSPVQERQMTSVLDANVHNIAINGTFDDGQRIVKALFNDLDFKESHSLGAVNSINWARILAQVVYYFYAWGQVTGGDVTQKRVFSVPTGNFGDIFAGYVAFRMGLPISRLILATNQNDILSRFVRTGAYQLGEVRPSISPSMDIQVSSNFERYLYYLLEEDADLVREKMESFAKEGVLTVDEAAQKRVDALFDTTAVSEKETLAEIKETFQGSGYVLDPHTAVGTRAAREVAEGAICLSTAHPAKFGEAVKEATGQEPELPPSMADLLERETRCARLDAEEAIIKQFMIDALDG
ncbi:MAG: threonine synthase [Magnetococcales bacterium]|nr:threonine synthase [Magnetococcales bacterium]